MSKFDTNYPILNKVLVESAVPSPRSGGIFATMKKYKVEGGKQVYQNGTGKKIRYYVWDHLHGHWEVYNRRGKNIFSKNNEGNILEEFSAKDDRKRLKL